MLDLFIAFFCNASQLLAKSDHAVVSSLKSIFVHAVLFNDLEGLLRALPKSSPDGLGGNPLLPGQGSCHSGLQRVVKTSEVSYDRSPISKSIIKGDYRLRTRPYMTNQ
jgi:hypothetical protein